MERGARAAGRPFDFAEPRNWPVWRDFEQGQYARTGAPRATAARRLGRPRRGDQSRRHRPTRTTARAHAYPAGAAPASAHAEPRRPRRPRRAAAAPAEPPLLRRLAVPSRAPLLRGSACSRSSRACAAARLARGLAARAAERRAGRPGTALRAGFLARLSRRSSSTCSAWPPALGGGADSRQSQRSPSRSSSSRWPRRCCSRPTPGRTGSYGRIANDARRNPYRDPPDRVPGRPGLPYAGADWRDTTSVYGPAFTLASQPVARRGRRLGQRRRVDLQDARGPRGAGRGSARSPARARPALRAGVRRLEPAARRPSRGRRPQRRGWPRPVRRRAGACACRPAAAGPVRSGRSRSSSSGSPLVFLPLRALEPRRDRPADRPSRLRARGGRLLAPATGRYGLGWLTAFGPLAREREPGDELRAPAPPRTARGAGRARPGPRGRVRRRPTLARPRGEARSCAARLAAARCCSPTPWLAVWYTSWAVPLAAVEDDGRRSSLARALRLPAAADDPALVALAGRRARRPPRRRAATRDRAAARRPPLRPRAPRRAVHVARPRLVDGDPAGVEQ